MTDRELLELAAKAAGVEIHGWFGDDANDILFADIGPDEVIEWNPLTDDGDALRLAVKLNLLFPSPEMLMHFLMLERFSRQGDNDCVATRRAIVRAAAEIGGAK